MQDILNLGEETRMNRPSVAKGNWEWRLLPDQLNPAPVDWLPEVTYVYGRQA